MLTVYPGDILMLMIHSCINCAQHNRLWFFSLRAFFTHTATLIRLLLTSETCCPATCGQAASTVSHYPLLAPDQWWMTGLLILNLPPPVAVITQQPQQ